MTRLVVGLGNPGPDHIGTRHNVGFGVLDHLARHEGLLFRTPRELPEEFSDFGGPWSFQVARCFDPDVFLVKPETFMNRSGDAVAPLAAHLGVEPGAHLLVVYDDMDLEVGALRIRPQGGAGGHNGMRSLISLLGTDRFPRLRVGIGRPGTDAARHVLSGFDEREREEIAISVAEAAEAILAWLLGEPLERVMTRFHSRWSVAD